MNVLGALADRRFRDMYIQTLPWADPVYPLVWRSLFSCHCILVEEERSKIGFLFESLLNSTVSFHCSCYSRYTYWCIFKISQPNRNLCRWKWGCSEWVDIFLLCFIFTPWRIQFHNISYSSCYLGMWKSWTIYSSCNTTCKYLLTAPAGNARGSATTYTTWCNVCIGCNA